LATIEYKFQVLRGNVQRPKTERQQLGDMWAALDLQRELARVRMAHGTDGNKTVRAADRVGELYKVSGKTVTRRLKILKAIEKAENAGDVKKAAKIIGLLEAKKFNQALDLVEGKAAAARKARKAGTKKPFNEHSSKALAENSDAIDKVKESSDLAIVEGDVGHTLGELAAKRSAMGLPRWQGLFDQVMRLAEAARTPAEVSDLVTMARALLANLVRRQEELGEKHASGRGSPAPGGDEEE
jgi:hypothetical protein